MSEVFTANLRFNALSHIVSLYSDRGSRAVHELAPAISESMHYYVLEEFETEGRGRWPGFWWQRAGLPAPGTPKSGPLRRGGKGKQRDKRLLGRGKVAKSNRRWQGNPKLLQDTGNLINSLTPTWDEDAVEVYTNVPYAVYHVSPEPRRVIPLRDFMDIDASAFEEDVVSMIDQHFRRSMPTAAE